MAGTRKFTPPPEKQCAATTKAGDRCPNWAAWKKGLDVCTAHAGLLHRQGAKARKDKSLDQEEYRAGLRLSETERRLARAEAEVQAADPFDPMTLDRLFSEKAKAKAAAEEAEAELRRLQAARLHEPERTAEMVAAGRYWRRSETPPWREPPADAIQDPVSGVWFTWVIGEEDVTPQYGPRNLRPADPDVQRLVVQQYEMPDLRPSQQLLDRLAEVTQNGYALLHHAGEAGMEPEAYLDALHRRIGDARGHDVDLAEDGARDYREVIEPRLRRAARRNAWRGIGPIS